MTRKGFIHLASDPSAGVTYRQLSYWAQLGLLPGVVSTGSGHPVQLDGDQISHVLLMARLIKAGFTPRGASAAAANLLGPARRHQLIDGYVIVPVPTRG